MNNNISMVWNVIYYNFNHKQVEVHNVFNHYGFYGDVIKYFKKYKRDKTKFVEELRRSLMYYYWSKCEWEVVVAPIFNHPEKDEMKIDVYWQVKNNWDIFVEYTWNELQNLSNI